MRVLRRSACCVLAWLLVVAGLIAIAATPVDANDDRLADIHRSAPSAMPVSAMPGPGVLAVSQLERARSGEAFGGIRSQLSVDGAAGLDQIQMHLLDRAKQEVSESIWQPGFRMWPSSEHLQLVGLKTWFRVEDDAWRAPVEVRVAFGEPETGPDPSVPSDVLTASASAPSLVQYRFADGTYSCPVQGKAWSAGATSSGSCRRGWDTTTAVEPQKVEARLVYDIEWVLNGADGSTTQGAFRSYGQWTEPLSFTVGELGTVVSDGTMASQAYPPADAGPDMVSTSWQDPDACRGLDVRCYAAKGLGRIWNWSKAGWDALSAVVYEAASLHLLFLTTVTEVAVGCGANVVDFFTGLKDLVVMLTRHASDPLSYLREQFGAFKLMYDAAKVDAVAFATEIFEGAFELELAREKPAQWAGKFGCQLAVGLFTGGGSLFASLGAKFSTMRKLIDQLNDFVVGRSGLRQLDTRHADRLERDQLDGLNNGQRREADRRPDNDQPDGTCLVNSFPTGTPVVMADGTLTPIEHIKPGDLVLGADPNTGVWRPQQVIDQWSYLDSGRMATATLTNGSTITATDHHLFWVTNQQAWIELHNIQPGDRFLTPTGPTTIADLHVTEPLATLVWELDTTTDNTYAIHTGTSTVLTHNQNNEDCTPDAPRLTDLGNGSFRSQGGLVYGPDPNPSFASRVDHVLAHGVDDVGRPIHGVFSGDALALTDEAWSIAQNGGAVATQQGGRTSYFVNMGRDVGYVGGQAGAAAGNPSVSYIQIVVQNGNELVTAFPVSGIPMGG